MRVFDADPGAPAFGNPRRRRGPGYGPGCCAGAALILGSVAACHGPGADPAALAPLPASAASRSLRADWDDTDAAVIAGVDAIEAVVAETIEVSEVRRRYTLRLSSGEPGTLDAERATEPGDVRLKCRIGLAGDPARERRLLDAVSRRLVALRGDRAAPIR